MSQDIGNIMTFQIYDESRAMYVDILPLIRYKGIKYTRNDIDSENAGRSLDGLMHRGRIAIKVKLDITCRSLSSEEVTLLFKLIKPEYVMVRYVDPLDGLTVRTFYSNNVPATFCMVAPDGTAWWDDIQFPLIEQ